MKTQANRLKEHLENGGTITSLGAYTNLGITQLATRISELEESGFKIERNWINVTNRFNETCHVVEYSHKKEGTKQ